MGFVLIYLWLIRNYDGKFDWNIYGFFTSRLGAPHHVGKSRPDLTVDFHGYFQGQHCTTWPGHCQPDGTTAACGDFGRRSYRCGNPAVSSGTIYKGLVIIYIYICIIIYICIYYIYVYIYIYYIYMYTYYIYMYTYIIYNVTYVC